jgi:hypothetical protein
MKTRITKLSNTEFVPQVYYILSGWVGVTELNRTVYTKEDQLKYCVVNSESLALQILESYKVYEGNLEKLK